MKTKSFIPDECVHSSLDAHNIFLKTQRRNVTFKPFIINFHRSGECISSICWKGDDKKEQKEAVISAFRVPKEIVSNFEKTEYIPLDVGDTMILNGKVITVEKQEDEYLLMQLPFVADETQATAIAKTLTGKQTAGCLWHLAVALKDDEPLCQIWVCLSMDDGLRGLTIPAFGEDQYWLTEMNDLNIINPPSNLIINDGIYRYHYDNGLAELEFICPMPQGLPC